MKASMTLIAFAFASISAGMAQAAATHKGALETCMQAAQKVHAGQVLTLEAEISEWRAIY